MSFSSKEQSGVRLIGCTAAYDSPLFERRPDQGISRTLEFDERTARKNCGVGGAHKFKALSLVRLEEDGPRICLRDCRQKRDCRGNDITGIQRFMQLHRRFKDQPC
jgi:hypothetical protein